MGLIQVMVAGAILAGLGVFMAQIATNSGKIAKSSKNSMDIAGKFAQVQHALLKDGVCQSFLGGHPPGLIERALKVNGNTILKAGLKVSGTSFVTESIELVKGASGAGDFIKVVFKKSSHDKSFGPSELVRRFDITVDWTSAGWLKYVVKSCHSDVGNAINSAYEKVSGDLPSCIYVDGEDGGCHSQIFHRKEGEITFPLARKYTQCWRKYKLSWGCWGSVSATRDCKADGWDNPCETGKMHCYMRKGRTCENKVELNNQFKTIQKCCR